MARRFYTLYEQKFTIWDYLFTILFHKDSKHLKSLDIGLQEVGAKICLNGVNKTKKICKNLFWLRQFYTLYQQKISNLRPHLSITFPQRLQIFKKFGHWTLGSGGNKLNWVRKCDEQTNRQTTEQTNIPIFQLIESFGPEGPWFEEKEKKEEKKPWSPCERPSLPVRAPASLWEAWPSCRRPGLSSRGLAFLGEAQPLCARPSLPVRSFASLWEAWPFFERSGLPVRAWHSCKSPASLRAVWPPCEQPSLPLRGQESLWVARPPCEWPVSLWEARPLCVMPCLPVRGPASLCDITILGPHSYHCGLCYQQGLPCHVLPLCRVGFTILSFSIIYFVIWWPALYKKKRACMF